MTIVHETPPADCPVPRATLPRPPPPGNIRREIHRGRRGGGNV